jgi:hypothetical protein
VAAPGSRTSCHLEARSRAMHQRPPHAPSFLPWLHVYQDIYNGRDLFHDLSSHPTSKIVGLNQGHIRIGLDVQDYPVPPTHLTCENFLGRPHTVHPAGHVSDFLEKCLIGGPIHEVLDRRTKKADAVEEDNGRREESGRIIGQLPSWAPDEGHADTHKGGERGDCVGPVVPSIGANREAVHLFSNSEDLSEEGLLYSHYENEDPQREWSRSMMGSDNLPDGLYGDPKRGSHEEKGYDSSGEALCLPIPEGIFLVRRAARDVETSPEDERGEHVRRGFYSVSDEGVGVTQDPGKDLYHRQEGVGEKASLR